MTMDHSAPEGRPTTWPITHEVPGAGSTQPDALDTVPTISAAESTAALRRCTALATRARVELLGHGRHSADELSRLLEEMVTWEDAVLADPDPTMLVLAAASLQDLAERLDDPVFTELRARIVGVLARLHAELDPVRPAERGAAPLGVSA